MNEEKAIALLVANLKGSKKKPSKITDFALACRTLKKHSDWGFKKMASFFNVSITQLREIDKINDLDTNFKKLANDGKIGMTTAYQLTRIDPKQRTQAFEIIKNLNRDEIRDFVYFLKKNPTMPVKESQKIFEDSQLSKTIVLALPISNELQKKLLKSAKKHKQTIHDRALEILKKDLKD